MHLQRFERRGKNLFFFLAARLRKCTRGKINVVWSRRGTGGSCGNISMIFPQGGRGKSIFCEICVEAAQLLLTWKAARNFFLFPASAAGRKEKEGFTYASPLTHPSVRGRGDKPTTIWTAFWRRRHGKRTTHPPYSLMLCCMPAHNIPMSISRPSPSPTTAFFTSSTVYICLLALELGPFSPLTPENVKCNGRPQSKRRSEGRTGQGGKRGGN